MSGNSDPFRRTVVKLPESTVRIKRSESMLWMGSCFVESLSPFLKQYGYQVHANPLGVVFHPLVIRQLLQMTEPEFQSHSFEKDGVWLNYWLGHPFHGRNFEELNNQIREARRQLQETLQNASWLVMTWGTAFWYDHKDLGMVGKCHKQPQSVFTKRRSSPNEIVALWKEEIHQIRQQNPTIKILLTLSPVRHTRDGLEENAVSKSALRVAIQQLTEELPDIHYFPAYEIMLDELRDYRFFERDLIHPNAEAVSYIWNRFSSQWLDPEEVKQNDLIQEVIQLENHRPLISYGKEYETWLAMLEKKKAGLKSVLPSGFSL
jgi:hypothetical protein